MHEASLYENNCFLTLTYRTEDLPPGGSLRKKDFQDFMKRLRKAYTGHRIRYFHCGEYGDELSRPHYHACLFNFDFADKRFFKETNGQRLYVSEELERLWPFGFSLIGSVTFESAAYVARYIMKKVTGTRSKEHYERVDKSTGEVFELEREYTTMSRRPGIGKDWLRQYIGEVFPNDEVVVRGRLMKPPRFYDEIYEVMDPEGFERLKRQRKQLGVNNWRDQTDDRLKVRETVKKAQVGFLKRGFEDEV